MTCRGPFLCMIAVAAWPTHAQVRLWQETITPGLGYPGLHDPSKARDELRRAVEISPDLLDARTALGAL